MVMSREAILRTIKENIVSVVPDADVLLFGSRARGDWHYESDWDILILTKEKVTSELDDLLFDKLYPVTLQIFHPVNFILVHQNDWLNNPAYYSLSLGIKDETILL